MFFLKNHTQNIVEKQFPDPSLKYQILYVEVKNYQNILKLWCRLLVFTSHKVFKKLK